ncbi:MAG TPA: hypothetical protein VKV73_05920 [Chloroflexota bacterium]|nr:hypothetical protein [Chloroflexota bacterium]
MHWLFARARIAAVCGMGSGLLLILAGIAGPTVLSQAQQVTPSPGVAPSPPPTATPLSLAQLTAIQPGLSGFMMEAAQRLGIMWFAAQQTNWDLAAFEGREAKDTLHRGGLKSNQSRQQGIEAFNTALLDPLIQAAQAGDQARFEQAYRIAILGCNGCHSTQTYGQTGRPFSFVKIQVPKNSPEDVYAYAP